MVKKNDSKASTVTKGKIVERIVALMHDQSGVTVQRNQFLPSVSGTGRKREIDVLIIASITGYQVRLAIECKNEIKAIGSPMIDAFVGKLQHVGIPSQHGIYVSASGYTADAVERAKTAGIKTLTLRGLNDDLLGSVSDAFQSTIYLRLEVLNEIVTSSTPPSENLNQTRAFGFYNEKGKLAALLPDLVWRAWVAGQIPSTLGEHEVEFPLPAKLHAEANGNIMEVSALTAQVRVIGLAVMLQGKTQNYALVNAADEAVEKVLTDVSFEALEPKLPVTALASEEQLQAFLSRPGAVRAVTRVMLPRIVHHNLYWPPSERVARLLQEHEQELLAGNPVFTFQELEGTDLQTVWEPIAESHPAHQWMKQEAEAEKA